MGRKTLLPIEQHNGVIEQLALTDLSKGIFVRPESPNSFQNIMINQLIRCIEIDSKSSHLMQKNESYGKKPTLCATV